MKLGTQFSSSMVGGRRSGTSDKEVIVEGVSKAKNSDDGSLSVCRRRKAGSHLWPGQNFSLQLSHNPFAFRASISFGVSQQIGIDCGTGSCLKVGFLGKNCLGGFFYGGSCSSKNG